MAYGLPEEERPCAYNNDEGGLSEAYLKKIRLHQARTLMLHDGVGAGIAARRVGYNSEFQFSREYRRLFGQPPMRDVAALRAESGAVGAR